VFAGRMISPGCTEFEVRLPRDTTALYLVTDHQQAEAFLKGLAETAGR